MQGIRLLCSLFSALCSLLSSPARFSANGLDGSSVTACHAWAPTRQACRGDVPRARGRRPAARRVTDWCLLDTAGVTGSWRVDAGGCEGGRNGCLGRRVGKAGGWRLAAGGSAWLECQTWLRCTRERLHTLPLLARSIIGKQASKQASKQATPCRGEQHISRWVWRSLA